ncbi:hypothetical protein JJD41_18820 [Oxynema sp. CENA135]|uniref:hypothetical protein n=1 Tax=Oxynema sp. CENA135 TaxID=984206 RepID=UPI001909C226|nr:hypothetical protein [Oxynema sp. CENA135]MBK4731907.1 hypothetical protein [Oxynema sp. CENA135]
MKHYIPDSYSDNEGDRTPEPLHRLLLAVVLTGLLYVTVGSQLSESVKMSDERVHGGDTPKASLGDRALSSNPSPEANPVRSVSASAMRSETLAEVSERNEACSERSDRHCNSVLPSSPVPVNALADRRSILD